MYGSAANELANSTMREPTLKPTINSYGQQLLNTNPVNRVTGKGIASLAGVLENNRLINYNRNNPSSLLRNIVNYVPNVATNLLNLFLVRQRLLRDLYQTYFWGVMQVRRLEPILLIT